MKHDKCPKGKLNSLREFKDYDRKIKRQQKGRRQWAYRPDELPDRRSSKQDLIELGA